MKILIIKWFVKFLMYYIIVDLRVGSFFRVVVVVVFRNIGNWKGILDVI